MAVKSTKKAASAKAPAKKVAKAPAAAKAPAKAPAKKVAKSAAPAAPAAAPAASSGAGAGVHIISSKVCNAFKTRAEGLAAEVKKAKPGVSVTIDHQPALKRNPDTGSFIITANGKTLVSCVAMPRPFTTMKALDMAAIAKQVIATL